MVIRATKVSGFGGRAQGSRLLGAYLHESSVKVLHIS